MFLRHVLLPLAFLPIAVLMGAAPGRTQSVPDSCTLTQPSSAGLLVAIGSPLPTKLSSDSSDGGTSAQFAIACTQSVFVQVSTPVQVGGPSFSPASALAKVGTSNGGQTSSATPGQAISILQNVNTTLAVDMFVDRGSNLLLAGTYTYNIILTITP
jgi:hypothetical protein